MNQGKETIEDIVIIASDPKLFGFRIKKIEHTIKAGEKVVEKFLVRIHSSDITSIRCLFIYKSGGFTRLKILIVPISPTSIA